MYVKSNKTLTSTIDTCMCDYIYLLLGNDILKADKTWLMPLKDLKYILIQCQISLVSFVLWLRASASLAQQQSLVTRLSHRDTHKYWGSQLWYSYDILMIFHHKYNWENYSELPASCAMGTRFHSFQFNRLSIKYVSVEERENYPKVMGNRQETAQNTEQNTSLFTTS